VKRIEIPFVGAAYQARSKNLDAQTCINYYLEHGGEDSKAPNALLNTPGTVQFADCGEGEGRDLYPASIDRGFAVIGSKLFEIFSDGTVTERGTLNTATGKVSSSDNGIQLMLVDGLNGYIFTFATNVFEQIVSPNFPNGARSVTYIDGYFIVPGSIQPDPGLFAISRLRDGLTWDGLEFGSAEGSPDKLITIIALNREAWALGSRSKEVFYDSENLNFPFDRIQGTFADVGCLSANTAQPLRGSLFWLGASKDGSASVWMSRGYSPLRISTFAMEIDLDQWTDAYAWVYEKEGHAFYNLTSNLKKKTWSYDIASGKWHQRMYRNPITGEEHEYHVVAHAYMFGKNLVLSKQIGRIYELSNDVFYDDGAPIIRRRRTQHVSANGDKLTWHSLFLDVETGVGSPYGGDSEEAKNPVIRLRYSDDNAKTFSQPLTRPMGKAGQTKMFVEFRRLGTAPVDRVWEIETSAPVKHAIVKAGAEVTSE
jgi:hypothetical protein